MGLRINFGPDVVNLIFRRCRNYENNFIEGCEHGLRSVS